MAFPTTEARVEEAERELGVRLPAEYRMRLVARNGDELSTAGDDWRVFPVQDITNRRTTARSTDHIVQETRSARALEGFPKDAVAIASNGAGDCLVFLPGRSAGTLNPQVHVWSHETRKCKPSPLNFE